MHSGCAIWSSNMVCMCSWPSHCFCSHLGRETKNAWGMGSRPHNMYLRSSSSRRALSSSTSKGATLSNRIWLRMNTAIPQGHVALYQSRMSRALQRNSGQSQAGPAANHNFGKPGLPNFMCSLPSVVGHLRKRSISAPLLSPCIPLGRKIS
jgi:hypothetical protein